MSEIRTRVGDAGPRVAEGLREAIRRGDYAPGTRIRQVEVADRFGASRVPVREALRILENEGLVRLVANTGAWVSTLTLAECEEIYRMRERLEPLLLSYAAPMLDESALDELDELARAMSRTDDVDVFLDLDRRFHLGSYRGTRTLQLGDLVEKLWDSTQPYRRAYTLSIGEEARRIAHEEHHLLIAALRDDDVDEAERVLAGHIRRTRRRLARHPELFEGLGRDRV
ncbi:GntR family transcriptional regulator [Microbacterium sp. 18062]|uniref:GntR family transcriptional regulator n=1 Tax=Microbacterium sp. 18062 TaxID=2681410 RepID=UPI00135888D0|nr:GntR family transcriptional regulator [Microbacterium sp. 18062]